MKLQVVGFPLEIASFGASKAEGGRKAVWKR